MVILRGQIWWVDLAEPRGSAPGSRHPALMLQRDEVNCSRLRTVVVCVLSSQRVLGRAPGNILLPRRWTGLARDSVANVSQIATVDREDLAEFVGSLPGAWMDRVDSGLCWFLGIDRP